MFHTTWTKDTTEQSFTRCALCILSVLCEKPCEWCHLLGESLSFQIETSKKRGGVRYLPDAFTEQGVAMLSGILNSDKTIEMNIAIMRAFVEIRKIVLKQNDLKEQLQEIKERLGEHDAQLNQIYDAMENLLDEKASQRKWEARERIGLKNSLLY